MLELAHKNSYYNYNITLFVQNLSRDMQNTFLKTLNQTSRDKNYNIRIELMTDDTTEEKINELKSSNRNHPEWPTQRKK